MKQLKSKLTFSIISLFLIFQIVFSASCDRKNEPERKIWTGIKTLAGTNREFGEPFGIAVKGEEIYVSDGENGKILKIFKDGRTEILTDKLDTPSQIAFDKNGDLIVADSGTHTIKKVKSAGEIEIIAGTENQSGFQDGNANTALFNAPVGIAVLEEKIFVADTYNDRIRLIENGQVSTVAGNEKGFADNLSTQAQFDTPCGLAVWTDGRILIADTGNKRIRVLEQSGNVRTLAGNGNSNLTDGLLSDAELVQPVAVAFDEKGAIYIADGNAVRAIGRHIFGFVETVSNDRRGFSDGKLNESRFNRPSGLAVDNNGNLFVADSENQTVRVFSGEQIGAEITGEQKKNLRFSPEEFRALQPPRWMYNPPDAPRDIAGTLGEIRGEISVESEKRVWFHNGLDIAGGYGETARFIRTEKVLRPVAVENFDTLRELIRMPTIGYIHIRLGRDKDAKIFDDGRFQFFRDETGKLSGVRVPRGAKFEAGEAIGTLNPFNHVHLIAGRSGAEMNALDALSFPKIEDNIAPKIEGLEIFDESWNEIETGNSGGRITLSGKIRIVLQAFDQMNGGAGYRKLGVHRVGYQILNSDKTPLGEIKRTINFDRMPDEDAARFVYAEGSQSGYKPQTVFRYIASNEVSGDSFKEGFFDASGLNSGNYILRVFAADFFGNSASKDLNFEIIK
jgi:sugar lactone lactonase YvrE